jgi:hypothetical protein
MQNNAITVNLKDLRCGGHGEISVMGQTSDDSMTPEKLSA